ncbi:hypothetical protein XM53_18725 [Roseovarius atlanticus]|uniref:Uncharacterized protein n=1 Tax=Roseovarius atlanticus TaxID=1641875 RepID=A0A0T5NPR1_9RHOB|nr:hypothetical protein [Roseovarius atlanticus]KRS10957.1 hypothetical protein XM53_18725 [Roseovarius atlanticus]
MSGEPLSEAAMRDSLLDIRLPPGGALEAVADVLVSAGLAGCAALAIVGLMRLAMTRRRGAETPGVEARIAALRDLPEDARRVGLLHLLKEVAPERYDALRPKLYRPDAQIDVEAEVRAHV